MAMSQAKIDNVRVALQTLEADEDPASTFLEVVETGDGREVTIRANQRGLIYLASQLIDLAAAGIPGKHVHIDEAGAADRCERDVVFSYAHAPWE